MTIDQNTVISVLEEAISCLPAIREGVEVYRGNPNEFDRLETAYRDAQSIKGAASMIDQPDVYEMARQLEIVLRDIAAARPRIDDAMARHIDAKIDELEKLLAAKKEFMSFEEDLFAELSELTDEVMTGTPAKPADEDFDIDAETLEIFSLEAEDLLRNISEYLKVLKRESANYDALMEIRRSAHTLKGSAAIVGLKGLSSLAHRMEDLLDLLNEQRSNPTDEMHSLLAVSADCLSSLASGDNSPELTQTIQELYRRYELLMSSLNDRTAQIEAAAGSALKFTIEPGDDTEEDAGPADEPQDESDELHISGNGKASKNSVIRISLERLDELMRLFSEVLQSRAVIEQRLSDMEKQVMELQHSTGRLRSSAGKLEIDFEAGMLRGGAPKFAGGGSLPSASDGKEFDDLEFDRYTEFHQVTRQLVETGSDVASINIEMEGLLTNLESVFTGQRHLIDDIQKRLMQLRMVSFDSLARRLQRTIRITADQEEKLIELAIEGGGLEVDTQILDSLMEPLLHILRNAVSHGIESPDTRELLGKSAHGTITLRLSQEGTFIILTVSDDGRGIQVSDVREKAVKNGFVTESRLAEMTDDEILSLVFMAGLSTSTEVSEVSGRGVGMHIVKENLAKYQGTVSVASELRRGTTFTLRLPMALSVTRALLVEAGREVYAFPLDLVGKVIELSQPEFAGAREKQSLEVSGKQYGLIHFSELMGQPVTPAGANAPVPVLLLRSADKPVAIAVEQMLPPQEIILKPLCFPLQNLPGLLGASILGNGKVVPVLDLDYMLKQENASRPVNVNSVPVAKQTAPVMIVDDSPSVRRIMSAVLSGAGWQVLAAKDGIEAFEILQNTRELPAVIITDVEMPRMDGYELLATLKRQDTFRHIPVIIITSRAGEKHRRKALDLGVSDYVTKPYEDSALLATISQLAG